MLKVNEFERDIGSIYGSSQYPFSTQSNINYRVENIEELENNSFSLLTKIIEHFLSNQVPRLEVLDQYAKGLNTTIYNRESRREENKADYRRAHNFGKIIAQFVAGYTTSVPVKYAIEDDKQQEQVDEFNTYNDVVSLDNELMYDVAKYGRAFELQYRTGKERQQSNNVKLSNVFETFVIYDNTIERNPIAAVRIVQVQDISGSGEEQYTVNLYTDSKIVTFKNITRAIGQLQVIDDTPHFYNAVPIVEYNSNRYRTGWYEDVISLIDAYDAVNSDTSNYMTDVVNSLLVISGDFQAPIGKDGKSGVNQLINNVKKYGVLALQSGTDPQGNSTSIDAKYINPEFNSTASENYQQRLYKDIFMMSNVPNLSDESFSGNSSGVAMRYKIFGFEQAIAQTINSFKRSLGKRYELLGHITANLKGGLVEFGNVKVTFTPNLPYAISEEVAMLMSAGVPLSRKTMYNQTHFTDADNEEANLEQEEHNGLDSKEKDSQHKQFDSEKVVTVDDE
ncbi:phage portal protein [Leuconostoc citreum]|uniref:phage portal protein n=1 Tax=Leuconostoc citreum TaxID=33964 RepID=UPI0032DE4239